MQGWIKLYRNITDNWIYKEKRKFSKFEAWLDILLFANYKDNKFLFEGKLLEIKRGQILTSEVKLANKWDWSRKKVRNFLKLLQDDGMIVKMIIPNKGIIIEIVNYDDYQKNTSKDTSQSIDNTCIEQNEEQQKEQHKNNIRTTEEQHENTNKNVKNVKNEKKNIYSDIFNLYLEQGIIKHKELTDTMKKAIDKANKRFSTDEIKLAITRYGVMYRDKGNNYAIKYCKYKWTLQELLTREKGISEFLDEGGKWIRYTDNQQANNNEDMKVIEAYESLEYLKGGINFE